MHPNRLSRLPRIHALPRLLRVPRAPLASLALLTLLASLASGPAAAQTQGPAGMGLSHRDAATAWPTLRMRLMPSLQEPGPQTSVSALPRSEAGGFLGQGLVADLYLSSSGFGPKVEGGFRATSGWLQTPGAGGAGLGLQRNEAPGALPYLGVGYSGFVIAAGVSVQADLGLVAAPGSVRLGRGLQPAPAVEELIRDLRLAPVVRLGVSYAF